ncbi:LysM peptidoglycan-binding domain-containing protein [Microbacterium sp. ZXX196]|uniref:LysM peptidoglycan-binding domain-containing protein n=1 Tax=Microbacterium sp. ZXX196 TaxID=2609291 RepID=UPI0012B84BF5|nr:LysM peptidoglycan-binding domain-containing protein [Microbacterium sp. ZXX196]MTE23163.1 LysM peptidoglycan-binding domain-containing protein [Microbacterium sp. ZXX196]
MSTVILTAPAAIPGRQRAARTRLRITRRGRRVLAAVAAAPVVVAVAAAVLGGGAALGSGVAGAPAGTFETVTVMSGDSLWSIAERVAPSADPRDVVDEIASLNGLAGAELEMGQRLALPAAYSTAD